MFGKCRIIYRHSIRNSFYASFADDEAIITMINRISPTRTIAFRIGLLLVIGILFSLSIFGSSSSFAINAPSSTNSAQANVYAGGSGTSGFNFTRDTTFIWYFGFIGNTFYPGNELHLSQQDMVNTARNLDNIFGKKNLILLTSVDEIPQKGGVISKSNIPKIASYISKLKQYASAVYGRLDVIQFNLTSLAGFGNCDPNVNMTPCPLFNETSMYINQLHLDGIWYDHVVRYYGTVGNETFNQMMENLTTDFPNTTFILNHTPPPNNYGYITELPGFNWENHSYVAPSPPLSNKTIVVNDNVLQQLYDRFPGHVLMHMDAAGPPGVAEQPKEPMSIFADMTKKQEIKTLTTLVYNGAHPKFANESYSMVIPIVGSWTCNQSVNGGPNYHGKLYNSLSIGVYPRFTFGAFTQIVLKDQWH
jgi:hypothetical protein